jgi:hypothetical protein
MYKFVGAVIFTVFAACTLYAIGFGRDDVNWHAVLVEAKQREAEIDAEDEQRRLLAHQLETILARFEHGQINLAQTMQEIQTQAAALYPEHLGFINLLETGESLEEKIGYNVVRHFHWRQRHWPSSETFHAVQRSEAELRAMLGHELVDMSIVQ